jgi:large subunit ribosomal protein L18Ae
MRQFIVCGRKVPTTVEENPQIFRMRVFANDEVVAKSRFWYFINKMQKVKKTRGEILEVSEVADRKPTFVKNYGMWIRYQSRSGVHNMYKEFRDTTVTGAVSKMYCAMAGQHRARYECIQIIKVAELAAADCKRPSTTLFHSDKVAFPHPARYLVRTTSKQHRTTFAAKRPAVF